MSTIGLMFVLSSACSSICTSTGVARDYIDPSMGYTEKQQKKLLEMETEKPNDVLIDGALAPIPKNE